MPIYQAFLQELPKRPLDLLWASAFVENPPVVHAEYHGAEHLIY